MNRKSMLSLLLAVVMLLSACGAKPAETTASETTVPETIVAAETEAAPVQTDSILGEGINVNGKLVIVHTNDVHGRAVQAEDILGYTAVAALRDALVAEGAEVLLLDAGDASQGMPIVNMSKGEAAMDFMNAVGYDAMALGNHEFDWNSENALHLVDRANFPVLGANIVVRSTGEPFVEQHVVFEKAGRKIGVFGIDTPETATKTAPNNVRDIQVLKEQEMYDCAQAQIDALKDEGCDFIIMVCHLGVDEETAPNRSIDVAEHTNGIDLVIDGHSHTVMEGGEVYNNALITSTGSYLANIGWVIVDEDGLTAGLHHADNLISEEKVSALVNQVADEVNNLLSEVIAQNEVHLEGDREVVRRGETNLGDLSCDALLWGAKEMAGIEADFALVNSGGIRATIEAGDISELTIKTVYPFANTMVVADVTGAELLEALEASCFALPDKLGGFPQVAGIEFTVDTSVPYESTEEYPGTTYGKPANPGSRVTITSVNGKPFDVNAVYHMVTNDFVMQGGDTYYVFAYSGKTATVDTGLLMEDVISDYIRQALGGIVTAAQYGESAGRIIIK